MTRTKALFAATAIIIAAAAVTFQPKTAEALPRIQLGAQVVEAGVVTKVGYRRRAARHFFRHHVRRGHWRGYNGRAYAGNRCHRHFHKVPGIYMHPRVRCGHWHLRAYGSWN